jgi:hypothetical protein
MHTGDGHSFPMQIFGPIHWPYPGQSDKTHSQGVAGTKSISNCHHPSPMGTEGLEEFGPEEEAFQKLAEDLRTETSAQAILNHLEAVVAGIEEPLWAEKRAHAFLQAGGLATLIRHFRGTATSDAIPGGLPGQAPPEGDCQVACHLSRNSTPDVTSQSSATSNATSHATPDAMRRAITDTAGKALAALLNVNDATRAVVGNATDSIPPLIDALRAAPTLKARSFASHLLHTVADAYPEECMAMAEAGVVGLVLALYHDIWSSSWDKWNLSYARNLSDAPAFLVHVLVGSGTGAADDLRRAICSRQTVDAYIALQLVQVCHSLSYL